MLYILCTYVVAYVCTEYRMLTIFMECSSLVLKVKVVQVGRLRVAGQHVLLRFLLSRLVGVGWTHLEEWANGRTF